MEGASSEGARSEGAPLYLGLEKGSLGNLYEERELLDLGTPASALILNERVSLKHAHESNLQGALKEFHDKFRELALCAFEECEPPYQARGGMNVCLIPGQRGKDVTAAAREAAAKKASLAHSAHAAQSSPSALPPSVQSFVELIFSEKMMKAALEEQNIDLDKMVPL